MSDLPRQPAAAHHPYCSMTSHALFFCARFACRVCTAELIYTPTIFIAISELLQLIFLPRGRAIAAASCLCLPVVCTCKIIKQVPVFKVQGSTGSMHFTNAAQHACPARPASLHGSRLRSSTFARRLQLFSTATSCCSISSHTGESGVLTCSVQRQQQWRPWRGAAAACVRAAGRVP